MDELVVYEVVEVLSECGTLHALGGGADLAVVAHGGAACHCGEVGFGDSGPFHVFGTVVAAVETGEHHVELRDVVVAGAWEDFHVAVGVAGVLFHLLGIVVFFGACGRAVGCAEHVGAERCAVEPRGFAVLLAVEVWSEVKHVVGSVLVHGRFCRWAYEQKRVGRVAGEDHHDAEGHEGEYAHGQFARCGEIYSQSGQYEYRNPQAVANEGNAAEEDGGDEADADSCGRFLGVEFAQRPDERDYGEYGVDYHAGVEAQSEGVDEEQFEVLSHLDESGHESEEDQRHDDEWQQQGHQRAFGRGGRPFLVVEHKDDGGDAEQVEQVDRYGDAYDVGYQHQIAVAVWHVGSVFPLQDEPEHQSGAEGWEGVNLAFHGRVPECVAPGVGEGAHESGTEYGDDFGGGDAFRAVFDDEPPHQVGYGPEEQHDGAGAEQGVHGVDSHGDFGHVAADQIYGKSGGEHEDGVARRVSYFKFEALRDEFRAVPEGCRGFDCQQITHTGDQEAEPAERVIDDVVASIHHLL